MSLLPVEEAQARLLALTEMLPTEQTPLADCVGRWTTANVMALRDQPFADLSAMDGYAVAAGAGPWRVTQESAAGGPLPPPLVSGEAARIFTGAPVPPGADSILIQENATRVEDYVSQSAGDPLLPGLHVRRRGSDFTEGDMLLSPKSLLGPAQLGLAALGGHGALPVRRKPRVSIIATGNELVAPGAPIPLGKIPSSNTVMLSALLQTLACDVEDLGIVADNLDAMTAAFDRARHADVIVSTGGASVGDHDLVRPAFEAAGGTLDFWKIRMRPGKPLIAGKLGETAFLGLPGNPVSAYVTATLFVLPLIRHLLGNPQVLPFISSAPLANPLGSAGDRDEYLRARLTREGAVALTAQDSAATKALAQADCLIVRKAHSPAAMPGETVSIIPL
ncbi:molybdopterin molybdenumtransferase MoeA [Sphingobium sp. SCG-1]|uniref:molybdopterin molybdotransferase MoeA n=1 Tax=Sphingobium sp. SCG-1 TaxID=2072936 RepID=UPI000CD69AB6|nr:gephyrin-like molybdotransferase Glp [Sphingobium sp. SCG-1]AUW58523.1 molybdopterin molybdenumtransferase MoeA [Sphingobium sp. SCG-1]